MNDHESFRREVDQVSRWVCIALWTFIMAPLWAFVALFPIGIAILVCGVFIGWEFPYDIASSELLSVVYFGTWMGAAFFLGFRGNLPGTQTRQSTLCANCNYDLRGNISGICPECGNKT